MVLPVQRERPPCIGMAVMAPVVRAHRLIRRVIGVGEFVILGLDDPSQGDAEPLYQTDPLMLEASRQVLVKELVVPDLVCRDIATDLLEHGFPYRVAQRRVIRARSNFDHAAGDHLTRTRAAARASATEIDAIAGLKALKGIFEIVAGIGERSPSRQCPAVLNLLLAPAPRITLEVQIVVENAAQMICVGTSVVFDEARRLDDRHDIWIELAAVKAVPRNIVERPVPHGCAIPPAFLSAAG